MMKVPSYRFFSMADAMLKKADSQNQHGIAKRKETIAFFYGHLISRHGLFVAVQGRHQHDEGAFRQVEIGDKAVDAKWRCCRCRP